jgi:probable O-glycosylation ligase (exosortase A-associated)
VKIFAMFICATFVLRTVRDLWLIYFVVLAAAIYIGYEVNMYYFTSGWLILTRRGYGGIDNNGAALILAMGVPMCYFAWEAVRHWARWGFLLVVPVLVHAVLLSYSRGAMASLGFAAIFVWWRARNKAFITVAYLVMAGFVVAAAGPQVRDRFLSIGKAEVDDSFQSRQTTWKIAIRMANERPLFGYGIRNSNLFTYDYGADIPGRSIHSQYLQTAADSGWVALGLYLALLGSVLFGLWKVRRVLRKYTDPETNRVKSLASGLECAMVLFCVGALLLSLEHFEMPYILILLAVQLHAITRAVMARATPPKPSATTGVPQQQAAPQPPGGAGLAQPASAS